MKKIVLTFLAVLGFTSALGQQASAQTVTNDKLIAIDVPEERLRVAMALQ